MMACVVYNKNFSYYEKCTLNINDHNEDFRMEVDSWRRFIKKANWSNLAANLSQTEVLKQQNKLN